MLVKWSLLTCHCHTMQCCSTISCFGLFIFSVILWSCCCLVVSSCPHTPLLWIQHPWLYAPVPHCFPLLSCPRVWSTVFDPFDCEVAQLSFASIKWTVFASLKPYLWILNRWSCAFESRELRVSGRVKETHIRAKSRMGWLRKICLIIPAHATHLYFFQCFLLSNIKHTSSVQYVSL